jgi:nucleotide-binding universal stress UspA family protein
MKFVSATDFSGAADQATDIAVSLAEALGAEVELFHIVQLPALAQPEVLGSLTGSLREAAEAELDRRIEKLAGRRVKMTRRVEVGLVDETLAAHLEQLQPGLLALGGHGRRGVRRFLGSTAERMLMRARCPVLIVPERPVGTRPWSPGRRPLRITAGVDVSTATLAMTQFVVTLARKTACELDLVHLYWPPREHARLGLLWPAVGAEPDPSVPLVLRRQLNSHLAPVLEGLGEEVQPRLRATLGDEPDPLLSDARASDADLIALGNNLCETGSQVLARVRSADVPVLCVPVAAEDETTSRMSLSPARTVLVTTDFSPTANLALPQAYRLVSNGGTVVICHVPDPGPVDLDPQVRADLEGMLAGLVPSDAMAAGISTQTLVHPSRNTADGILQALRRTGADVLVMASHGRTGMGRALVGSVAESVMRKSPRPVLVVPSGEHQEG